MGVVSSTVRAAQLAIGKNKFGKRPRSSFDGDTGSSLEERYAAPLPGEPTLTTHANVFAAAVKYRIAGLRRVAACYFLTRLEEIEMSKDNDGVELAQAIQVAYSTTPDDAIELRDEIRDLLFNSGRKLLQLSPIGEAIESVDGLALDLLRRSHNGNQAMKPVGPVTDLSEIDPVYDLSDF